MKRLTWAVIFAFYFSTLSAWAAPNARVNNLMVDNAVTLGGESRTTWPTFTTLPWDNITSTDNAVTPAKLQHTGTADNTTFYRGDGKWTKVFRGALVTTSVSDVDMGTDVLDDEIGQSIDNGTITKVQFSNVVYDTDSMFSALDNTKLTPPSDVTKVRVSCYVYLQANGDTGLRQLTIRDDDGVMFVGFPMVTTVNTGTTEAWNTTLVSGIANVSYAGDFYEVSIQQWSGVPLVIESAWFSIEVIE